MFQTVEFISFIDINGLVKFVLFAEKSKINLLKFARPKEKKMK